MRKYQILGLADERRATFDLELGGSSDLCCLSEEGRVGSDGTYNISGASIAGSLPLVEAESSERGEGGGSKSRRTEARCAHLSLPFLARPCSSRLETRPLETQSCISCSVLSLGLLYTADDTEVAVAGTEQNLRARLSPRPSVRSTEENSRTHLL